MKYIINPIIFFVLSGYAASAQKDTIVFSLDSTLSIVPEKAAVYVQKSFYKDGLWFVSLYKKEQHLKVMSGSYKDNNLEVQEGLFEYFNNNHKILSGYYHDGEQSGIWKNWDAGGLLTDSVYFDAGKAVSQAKFQYHTNGHLWRYSLETDTKQKITRVYDTLDVLVSEGRFKDTDGEMFIYYPGGKIKTHSVYKGNQRTVYDFFDEDGKKYTESEYNEMIKKP